MPDPRSDPRRSRRIALVAEDHDVFREAIDSILRERCGFDEVHAATSFDEVIDVLGRDVDVSLLTLDLGMPGVAGGATIARLRRMRPGMRLAVVTARSARRDMVEALSFGAQAFIPKVTPIGAIAAAIDAVMADTVYVPWDMAVPPAEHEDAGTAACRAVGLTRRQRDVLRSVKAGRTNKEIARELGLAESTVKVHVNALFRVLGVHNRVGAAMIRVEDPMPGAEAAVPRLGPTGS